MKVAFVHDWLVSYRGGEKVLAALLDLYPDAPIYTLFYQKETMPREISDRRIISHRGTNAFRKLRKAMLPLLPKAIESFDFSGYDLIVSTSSCVAKGARPQSGGKHLCYIHSPMRYIWDQQDEYIKGVEHIPMAAAMIRAFTPSLRRWDVESADRVDQFVVNSSFVGDRVKKFYSRDSIVIAPPVELERFSPGPPLIERDYMLAAGALVSYKRFDLAIRACEEMEIPLVIAGQGPMEQQLRQIAGRFTRFEIAPSDKRMAELLRGARALLFPGVEDFGIIAIEAMASGTPLIAYRAGGALDYIRSGETGVFFDQDSVASLKRCIQTAYDPSRFSPAKLAAFAQSYSKPAFLEQMRLAIGRL